MKVLAFTPTYRLEPETVDAICRQQYLQSAAHGMDAFFTMDNPWPVADRGKRNVLYNYQRGRQVFLSGKWDAMWVVESDVIPPPDALLRMVNVVKDHGADVVYGVYLFRQPWPHEVVNVTEFYHEGARNRGESWKERPLPTGVTKCTGSGLGCTLITRHVLEAIDFRHGHWLGHCDVHFNDDVYQAGYSMMCDWAVVCGHKLPTGETIWPRSDYSSAG